MKIVLAISGGIDSMAMLDFCCKKYNISDIIVAHFDHGTRISSKNDAEFVERCCKKYNVKFVKKEGKLGENISEEKARKARYDFVYGVAENIKKETNEEVKIFTAHHMDDLVESVAINLIRGTGWRGLAVLNNDRVERPFVGFSKKEILKYACEKNIVFREDPTNSSENYLRNRIRKNVREMNIEEKRKIAELQKKQIEKEKEIEKIVNELKVKITTGKQKYSRKYFYDLDEKVAMEILRGICVDEKISMTRPQTEGLLTAIKTYLPAKKYNLPKDKFVRFTKDSFLF